MKINKYLMSFIALACTLHINAASNQKQPSPVENTEEKTPAEIEVVKDTPETNDHYYLYLKATYHKQAATYLNHLQRITNC
jgi:hypothetical protein